MKKNINVNDNLTLTNHVTHEKHGLHGHVKIMLHDKKTKKTSLWYEDDNIIPISGYQWILMKMFGLHLDSIHDPRVAYEDLGQDSTIIIPDLNNDDMLKIGRDPNGVYDEETGTSTGYYPITEDIPSDHFIQGFMVGNGGSGEDAITSKNTDYSFIKLRNPIPFQQTSDTGLNASIANKYLGVYRQPGRSEKNYYIKKFDDRPHVYHSWWRENDRWDYLDPVTQADLGPGPGMQSPKTNRIATYAKVQMSIDVDNDDCLGYFKNQGSTQTAMINELGLVAYDSVPGERSIIEKIYSSNIKRLISLIFQNGVRTDYTENEIISLAYSIHAILSSMISGKQSNIDEFIDVLGILKSASVGEIDYELIQAELVKSTNINVEAFYNQNGTYIYSTDKFLEFMNDSAFDNLSIDEAQRIKLITYYTFNSIPLEKNTEVLIDYRIYAN